ncbi:HAD family hydrolase [Nocardia sp. NEAU-G5]|uniref:HAD family hydrolase n=1 Tax=Nocardia albiluteola TaxID=2842303 RepID=A0ABS6B588_9NOCA|nr:HAD family hydrolase [Nocardia albiluteola]MBU3064364.1 HAD family hydrolase [Nocardia albiluteola]
MTPADALVGGRTVVLVDFDGPICRVFSGISNRVAAQALRAEIDRPMPASVQAASDPFDVLKFAASIGPVEAARVEQRFQLVERDAVSVAAPTEEAADVIVQLRRLGHRLAVVSNNSDSAVELYLSRRGLLGSFDGIYGRSSADVSQLKPSPFLLRRAVADLQTTPDDCVFVGDSVTDIEAAQAADMVSVGYANRPEKTASLADAGATSVIGRMGQLLPA